MDGKGHGRPVALPSEALSADQVAGLGGGDGAVEIDSVLNEPVKEPVVVGETEKSVVATAALNPLSVELNERWETIKSDVCDSVADVDGLTQVVVTAEEYREEEYQHTDEDDPIAVLDNTKSNIPFHRQGEINSIEDLQRRVNEDYDPKENKDRLDDAKACLKAVTVVPMVYRKLAHKDIIKKDHFRVARERTSFKLYGPGVVYPPLTDFKWYSANQEAFDDESTEMGLSQVEEEKRLNRKITDVHTLLQVGANHLGFGRIVTNRAKHNDCDAESENSKGREGDTVLFSQGKYLLKESEYRDIRVRKLAVDEPVIEVGNLATVMRIDAGQVGGALRLETNEFEIFKSGKTIILDKKEWANACVEDRRSGIVHLGKYVQYITVEEGYLASISRKDGRQFLLKEPGLYVLKHSNWYFESTELKQNADNLQIGPFIVRTVSSDHVGVARRKGLSNQSFILRKGKYYLHSAKWEVNVAPIARAEVYIKPFTFVQVGTSMYVGARNLRTGNFDEFHDNYQNKIIVLHETQYGRVVQVPKVSANVMRFGPWFTVTVSAGKVALFDRRGEITMEGPGQKKLALEDGVILEPLPTVGQTVHLGDITFLSSDDFDLGVRVNVDFQIKDYMMLAKLLRSRCTIDATDMDEMAQDFVERNSNDQRKIHEKHHGYYQKAWDFSLEDLKAELQQLATSNILSLFRTYKSSDLIIGSSNKTMDSALEEDRALYEAEEKKRISGNIESITSMCIQMLMKSIQNNEWGISIKQIHLLGGIRFADKQVLENFKSRTREATRAETMIAVGKSNEARAKAEAAAHIEKAREEATIKRLQLEGAREHERITLETMRLKTEQEIASEQLKRQKMLEIEKLQLEQQHQMELEQAKMQASIETLKIEEQKKQRAIELEIAKEKAAAEAEMELVRLKAAKEQEVLEMETKRKREEAQRIIDSENAKVQEELARLRNKLDADMIVEKAKAEAEAKRLIADAQEYQEKKINELALNRPSNLDVEEIMKIMNEGVKHFGNAAWRHPDVVEAMVGINSKDGTPQDYKTVVNQSVNQACSMLQMAELKKVFQNKDKAAENFNGAA